MAKPNAPLHFPTSGLLAALSFQTGVSQSGTNVLPVAKWVWHGTNAVRPVPTGASFPAIDYISGSLVNVIELTGVYNNAPGQNLTSLGLICRNELIYLTLFIESQTPGSPYFLQCDRAIVQDISVIAEFETYIAYRVVLIGNWKGRNNL